MKFWLYLLMLPLFEADSLSTENLSTGAMNPFASKEDSSKRYDFEDLIEAAKVLMGQRFYGQAQEILELALVIKPREIRAFRMLSEVYELTDNMEKLAILAESVSSYLLPQGEEDEFYEKMLVLAVSINSKKNEEAAWKGFLNLMSSLASKPGRQSKAIKKLETTVHVPFLARMYEYLKKKDMYQDFLWGKLGDYYLYRGYFDQAKTFLDLEFQDGKFDRSLLYSYARILYERKDFSLCQIYVNVGKKLNQDQKVLEELQQIQNLLEDNVYEIGARTIKKEVDLFFRFRAKEAGVKRLQEMLLLSDSVPKTWLELAQFLMDYPKEMDTWDEGRKAIFKFLSFEGLLMEEQIQACNLLLNRGFVEDLPAGLKKIQKDYPASYKKNPRILEIKKIAVKKLIENASVLERDPASQDTLVRYLNFILELDPGELDAYLKLCRLQRIRIEKEMTERKFLSLALKEESIQLVNKVEQALENNPKNHQLMYLVARVLTSMPTADRQYSRELNFLKQAVELDAKNVEYKVELARVYSDFEFFRPSLEILDSLPAPIPSDLLARIKNIKLYNSLKLASMAYAQNNQFLVLQHMQKALKDNGDQLLDKESSIWLAYAYHHTDRFQDNLKLMDQMQKVYGESIEIHYFRALAYQGLQKLEEALKHYDKVIEQSTSENIFLESCRQNRESIKSILEFKKNQ